MGIRSQLRGFVRAFRSGAGPRKPRHSGHSLAMTAKHTLSNSVRRGGGSMASTSEVYDRIADGADDYAKSFDKE